MIVLDSAYTIATLVFRSPSHLAVSSPPTFSSNNVRDSRKRKRQQDMRNQKLKAIVSTEWYIYKPWYTLFLLLTF